jgi:tRNA/rRNA methyltransferase
MEQNAAAQPPAQGVPVVILAEPQMGENIGAVARAMANFGLGDLRLVRPRDAWPNKRAYPMAAGADHILDAARVFDTVGEAVAGLTRVFATTARTRTMVKPVVSPEEAGRRCALDLESGRPCGYLFGGEKSGLDNEDVTLCDAIITIPTSAFSSLNLAQAVLICAYAWFTSGTTPVSFSSEQGEPAAKEDLIAFYEHLERELDAAGFLYPPDKRPSMVRNLRNIWARAGLVDQEVRTLRGVITALTRRRKSSD